MRYLPLALVLALGACASKSKPVGPEGPGEGAAWASNTNNIYVYPSTIPGAQPVIVQGTPSTVRILSEPAVPETPARPCPPRTSGIVGGRTMGAAGVCDPNDPKSDCYVPKEGGMCEWLGPVSLWFVGLLALYAIIAWLVASRKRRLPVVGIVSLLAAGLASTGCVSASMPASVGQVEAAQASVRSEMAAVAKAQHDVFVTDIAANKTVPEATAHAFGAGYEIASKPAAPDTGGLPWWGTAGIALASVLGAYLGKNKIVGGILGVVNSWDKSTTMTAADKAELAALPPAAPIP